MTVCGVHSHVKYLRRVIVLDLYCLSSPNCLAKCVHLCVEDECATTTFAFVICLHTPLNFDCNGKNILWKDKINTCNGKSTPVYILQWWFCLG